MGRRAGDLFLAGICGAGLALCLPRPGLCPLAWVILAPFFGLCERESPRQSAILGLVAGFAFHGLALCWIYSTCRFAGITVPLAILAWGALCLFLALAWAGHAALGSWVIARFPDILRPWLWAVIWTAGAAAWERLTPRLNADLLAYTQWKHLSLMQIGSIFGPHGLGFLIVGVNACLAQAWRAAPRPITETSGVAANAAIFFALMSAAWGWGFFQLHFPASRGPEISVEILQPNIDQYQKWDSFSARRILENFDELLSRPRDSLPALIAWPESSLPRLVMEGKAPREISAWGERLKTFHIVGVISQEGTDRYNAAFLIGPDGRFKGSYHKRQLVPFGEFVPLGFLKKYIGILNEMSDLTAGKPRQGSFDTPLGPAAAGICYEAMFPRWARLDAGGGARFLVNLTNDGWYGDTWGPVQHFYANAFRAVENRVTVIRAANTGISGIIDPWGRVAGRLDVNRRGRLSVGVLAEDPFPRRSFYSRHGDWLGLFCLAAAVCCAAWRARLSPIS